MAMDRKLLAAAKRELERDKAAYQRQMEARRQEIYAKEPRVRAIDRALSGTAITVLKAALESGEDPEQAVAQIRDRNLALQGERSVHLLRLGYPADYLTELPICKSCGDSRYHDGLLCKCVKNRYAMLLKEELSSVLPIADQNFATFRLSCYSNQPDARLGISPRENMEYNLEECERYAKDFSLHSPNLLLYGSTGLGKTFLSTCIADAVAAEGFSVVYDTAINITSTYETLKFGNGDGAAAAERVARYEKTDLLIIDDIGTEMGTAFTVSALYNLINNRLMSKKPMIINTNLLPEMFSEKYSPAVASRLLGEFISLRFLGDDIRLFRQK